MAGPEPPVDGRSHLGVTDGGRPPTAIGLPPPSDTRWPPERSRSCWGTSRRSARRSWRRSWPFCWSPAPAACWDGPRDRGGRDRRPAPRMVRAYDRKIVAASTAFGLLVVISAMLAAGRGAPGAPYAPVELIRIGAMFGVAVGAAFAARADARQRAAALRGDSRQRRPGGADRPWPAPPPLAAADPVDQRPRLDVRQPERRRRGGGDGDPVRVWSARLWREERPRPVAVASPDDDALSGAGDRLPGRGARARRLAGRRARDRDLLRAPPPPTVTRDRRRRGRGGDAGRRRSGDSRPLDRSRFARRQTIPAGHARGPRRRRSELAGRAHPPGALAAHLGALPFAAAGGDRSGELPRRFSSLRRAERDGGRRAVADGRPATRPQ